jgi:hypothetical protein
MAFSGPNVPNMVVVRYVMDNVWSVGRLETYITTYRPGGPPLHVLRHLLGHANLPAHDYARCLSQLASLLFGLGHVKPVNVVVAELLRNIPPGHLTPQQVHFCIYKILLSYSVTVSYSKIPIGLVLLPSDSGIFDPFSRLNCLKSLNFSLGGGEKTHSNPGTGYESEPAQSLYSINGLGGRKIGWRGVCILSLPCLCIFLKSNLLPGSSFHIIPSLLLPQLFPLISV